MTEESLRPELELLPTDDEVAWWETEEGEHFLSAILQPFVLAQRREI